jgi:hypothetical protein
MTTLSELLSLRKRRLELQREADKLEQEEKALAETVIQEMVSLGQDKAKIGDDVVYLKETIEPVATSWPDILDYIKRTGSTDLLQKRLTASAVKSRWDDGEIIDGIEPVTKRSLKFNV